MPKGAKASFHEVLEKVEESPDDATRSRELAGDFYRLQSLSPCRAERYFEGEIIRIRPSEPTILGDTSGHVTVLPHKDNQGPCSETAFLYDRATQALLMQVHRSRSCVIQFSEILRDFGKINKAIIANAILRPEFIKTVGARKNSPNVQGAIRRDSKPGAACWPRSWK